MEKAVEGQNGLINKLSVPTADLSMAMLQNTLNIIKISVFDSHDDEYWYNIADLLWKHLVTTFPTLESQFLCSTCFYNVLFTIKDKSKINIYLDVMIKEMNDSIHGKYVEVERLLVDSNNMFKVLCYIHGIFQMPIPFECPSELTPLFKNLFLKGFDLLAVLMIRYNPYTFMAFKLMLYYKKILGTEYGDILSNTKKVHLLNLVCLNFENPIPGVRDLNRSVFKMLINVLEDKSYNEIANEVDGFVWNKAKYLMLAEIIKRENKDVFPLLHVFPSWINGVTNSLYKPGLVSAGADMYFSILKGLNKADEWLTLFYNDILTVLTGDSIKAKKNFMNYWSLNTFKKFPQVMHQYYNTIDCSLYSSLAIMRQGNRLGLVNKDLTDQYDKLNHYITAGLVDVEPHVRLLAFDIVAVSNGISLPNEKEYNIIYTFLLNNVNSDSTILRINMLESVKLFLVRLHSSFNHTEEVDEHAVKVSGMFQFCRNIQMLIIDSLNLRGNYQRKITIVKLCNILLSAFKDISKKKREKSNKSIKFKPPIESDLIKRLKRENVWLLGDVKFLKTLILLLKDPAADVKESVITLLLNHYAESIIEHKMIDEIMGNAFECTKSKFFYKISCSQIMIKLVTSLLITHTVTDSKYTNIQAIFIYVCKLVIECKKEPNIFKSVQNGQQLHAYISILNTILLVTLEYNYDMSDIYQDKVFKDIIRTLESQSSLFVDYTAVGVENADFSQINDIVNRAIESGNATNYEVADDTKISDLQLIVLHTMWLNVKSACELAGTIIKCQRNNLEVVKSCLDVISNVLETCRHKGVIESAGTALGQSIRCLTSETPDTRVSRLPETFLRKKLKEMIDSCEATQSSVTRRGAGLSIMVHRIVSNDMRQGRPLFHIFMKILLAEYNKSELLCSIINDNEKDLPQAIYLHFLTKIVIDSSLGSDVMFYSAILAEIAFNNLTHDKWQIRNAALQLYGAIIPKLMGQKKDAGVNEETVSTVTFDELRVHFPTLWVNIRKRLNTVESKDILAAHSNLVPILNMLANSALRYRFSQYSLLRKNEDNEVYHILMMLLSSPIYTVRRLSAQCLYVMYPFKTIYDTLLVKHAFTENCIHGYLTLINVCYKHYYTVGLFHYEFHMLLAIYKELISKHEPNYLSKALFVEMDIDVYANVIDDLNKVFEEFADNKHAVGYCSYVNIVVQKSVRNCSVKLLPKVVEIILKQTDVDQYCNSIHERITSTSIPKDVLKTIVDNIIEFDRKFECAKVLKILYEIAAIDSSTVKESHIIVFYEYLRRNKYEIQYKQRYMIPFAAIVFLQTNKIPYIDIFNTVAKLSKNHFDTEMRFIASLANNQIATEFHNLPDEFKIISIQTAVILLQDEDEIIRNSSVEFIQKLNDEATPKNPYICLKMLLDFEYLMRLFTDKNNIFILCDALETFADSAVNISKVENYNPFTNESYNIYFEYDIFKKSITDLRNAIE